MVKICFLAMFILLVTNHLLVAQCGTEDALPSFDYSKVGYRQGDTPIPYQQRPATITYPEGRFTINSLIRLTSGQVLRGAGKDKTILYFPNGLRELGEPCGNPGVDCYDWKNAVIRATGIEIGIEDLTIEFRDHGWCHYCGSNNGGFNGIELKDCTNSWVKNVAVRKSDTGVFISGGSNNTVDGVDVYPMTNLMTHIHVAISGFAKNNLVTNVRAYGNTAHGLTGNWGVENNVFSNCWGENLYIEPDHNCNGGGGAASCSPNMMYSNITGTIRGIQTVDRAGNPLQTVLWNVGNSSKCPVDAYGAQLNRRVLRSALTAYENCDFGGYGVHLPATGGFSRAAMIERGLADNALSSFTIKPGYRVRFYQDDNYLGSSYGANASDNCLANNGFSDNVTSIWLRPDGVTTLSGNYYIKNRNGLYMDVSGGSTSDGATLVQSTFTASARQQFQFIHIENGVYQIRNVSSGKNLTIASGSYNNGAAVQQWPYTSKDHQKFIAYKLSNGNFQLILTHSNKILKIAGGVSTPGAAVEQFQNDNQVTSEWQLISVATGIAARTETNGANGMEEESESLLDISPNPVQNRLIINSSFDLTDARISILDAQGVERLNTLFVKEGNDVNSLSQGFHVVRIVTRNNNRITKKIIKQ
jgi:hypothetical protein